MLEGFNRAIGKYHALKALIRDPVIPTAEVGSFDYEETRPFSGVKFIPESFYKQSIKMRTVETQEDSMDMGLMGVVSLDDFPVHYYTGRGID